jgi:hypothetical protein
MRGPQCGMEASAMQSVHSTRRGSSSEIGRLGWGGGRRWWHSGASRLREKAALTTGPMLMTARRVCRTSVTLL